MTAEELGLILYEKSDYVCDADLTRRDCNLIAEFVLKAIEREAKCTIPIVSGSLPLAKGGVTKTREPLPTYHNKCDLCGEIFWTKDAFNNKCPECGREGWQSK